MKIAAYSPDLSKDIALQIREFCSNDADILLLPEYLLELTDFEPFVVPDKLVVFGSRIVDGQNCLYYADGEKVNVYKKAKLTPWEAKLVAGKSPAIFSFRGVNVGIVVCFDVEFPDIAAMMRGKQLDLLLVPSATESILGYERVTRCASARSVELGCAVMTCHLVGESENAMIDVNIGANNFFLPSQSQFDALPRMGVCEPKTVGGMLDEYDLPLAALRRQRTISDETNPSL